MVIGLSKKDKERQDEIRRIQDEENIEKEKAAIIKQAKAKAEAATEETKQEIPSVYRTEEGNLSGITLPDGRTFLGLSPEETKLVAEQQRAKTETPAGVIEQSQLPSQLAKTPEAVELIYSKIKEIRPTGDIEKDKLSYKQAIQSALASAGAGAVGGAAVGAVGGAAVGGVGAIPGAVGGAVLGSVGGFLSGFRSNLKTQRADMLKGEAANLMKQEQNLLKIVMNTNQGGDAITNSDYFYEQMSLIAENYERLKLESIDKGSFWLGEDAKRQMEKYETFYSTGGMHDILVMQMEQALLNPDPNKNLLGIANIIEQEGAEE